MKQRKKKTEEPEAVVKKSGVCKCGHAGPFRLTIRNHTLFRICKCDKERDMDNPEESE